MMMMITMNGLAGCSVLMLLMCVFDVHSVYGLSASSSLASSSFKLHRRNVSTLDELLSHDRLRHARHLASSAQSYPLYYGKGFYYAELQIGTPPANYYVQVDTGSDLLWLNCGSCTACPTSMSSLGVPLSLYDPASSSSSSPVDRGDDFCSLIEGSYCSASGGQACCYKLQYGEGTSEGYIVRDVLQLDLVARNQPASATITFGCATTPDPNLKVLDGILGLGPSPTSITSQLMNQNQAPTVFAHCLQGLNGNGGGTLVIGNVEAPGLVYTPIIEALLHYNVNLLSIGVNGQTIPVDSSVSSSDPDKGTIFDSGTTLAFFEHSVYQQLLAAIFGAEGVTCSTSSDGSLNDGFPDVTLTFEGSGSIMVLKPKDYFLSAGENEYCVGFQNRSELNLETTLLGDLVLANKVVVYDIGHNQIGWVDYDCSSDLTIES